MLRYCINSLLLVLCLLFVSPANASDLSRTFAGGTSTDNVTSSSSITATAQMSISFWLNITSIDATSRRPYSFSNPDYLIYDNGGSNNFSFLANFSTTGGQWNIALPSTGAWHHFLITYDSSSVSNNPIIYMDGASQTVTTLTAPVGTASLTNTTIVVGNRPGSDRPINGSMAGFARWSDIRSSSDATNLAAKASPCTISTSTLLVYYPMDHGDSPEPDFSGHNNSGTVTGTTTSTGPGLVNPYCAVLRLILLGVGQ